MIGIDIACIVFACVTANHLGLIGTMEGILGKSIPILNCSKCASFWFTLLYMVGNMGFLKIPSIPSVLAISFLASYAALWLELLEGYIDTLFDRLYDKIFPTDNTADDGTEHSDSVMPLLPGQHDNAENVCSGQKQSQNL